MVGSIEEIERIKWEIDDIKCSKSAASQKMLCFRGAANNGILAIPEKLKSKQ